MTKVVDAKKTFTLIESRGFIAGFPPTNPTELLLPSGTYVLEAEDSDYWYFKAPKPLRIVDMNPEDKAPDSYVAGGVTIKKSRFWTEHVGAYVDGKDNRKILIWSFGRDFSRAEGKMWKLSF